MKGKKVTSSINIIYLFLTAILVLYGCQSNVPHVNRIAQAIDTIPPEFVDLVYPDPGSHLPEGECVIQGALVDFAEEGEGGFSQDNPVFLEMDIIGSLGQVVNTQTYIVDCMGYELDPSFFNYETGEFRIEFGHWLRLKPYHFIFRLYGEDNSRNRSEPVVTEVFSDDIEGGDLGIIYEARAIHGDNLFKFISVYYEFLEFYEGQYDEDKAVIQELLDLIDGTYVTSPIFDTWQEPIDAFRDAMYNMDYPDFFIQQALETGADFLLEQYNYAMHDNSYPFYPYQISNYEILQLRQKIVRNYSLDQYIFDYDNAPQPPEGIAVKWTIFLYNPFNSEVYPAGDFIITAQPDEDLEITGWIGYNEGTVVITPDDYDPPISFLALMGEKILVCPYLLKLY